MEKIQMTLVTLLFAQVLPEGEHFQLFYEIFQQMQHWQASVY